MVLLYIGVTSSILIGYKHAASSCLLCFSHVIPTDNRFYICRSDVIPTDNSFMHTEVTSPYTQTSSLITFCQGVEIKFATYMIKMQKAPKGPQSQHWKFFIGIWRKIKQITTNERYACERAKAVLCANGTSYSKSTLKSLRFGLTRHFKATRGFDIINDSELSDANKVQLVQSVWTSSN